MSLRVPRGALVVVTGRVASGKTTLLRALLGLLPADGGVIRWNGAVVRDPAAFFVPPRAAYVPRCRGCSAGRCGTTCSWGSRWEK